MSDPILARLAEMEGDDWGPHQFAMLAALREVLDMCELKERAYVVAGRDPLTTTLFTANIRSHIAEKLGLTDERVVPPI